MGRSNSLFFLLLQSTIRSFKPLLRNFLASALQLHDFTVSSTSTTLQRQSCLASTSRLLRAPPLQSPHTPPLPPQILLRRVPLRRDALRSQGQVQHREQQDGGYVCECKYQAECRVVD